MNTELAQAVYDAIRNLNVENDGPRSYSGRGMFGDQCLGVTCDNPIKVAVEIACMLEDDMRDAFARTTMNTDSMGRSSILYFPYLEWNDETMSEYDEDEDE